jgi:beta-glucosidase
MNDVRHRAVAKVREDASAVVHDNRRACGHFRLLPVLAFYACFSALLPHGFATAAAREAKASASAPLSDALVRDKANALLAQMTPEEKAGQLSDFFYIQAMPNALQNVSKALEHNAAGALLLISSAAETNRFQRMAIDNSRLKIPLLFGFDVIHGLHTILPVPLGMAASWDPQMVEEMQAIAASEARAVGIEWTFAPNVDIARDARWGRIVEGAGEDPYLGAAMAAAQVRGFQGPFIGSPGRIIAGPKHFAGYGASVGGRDYDEANISDNELWNVYLPPFRAAVDAGAGNIMSAYMPLNGVPASGNAWLLTKVLRNDFGFRGFVVSDNGAVLALTKHGLTANREEAAIRALRAGMNMEMSMGPDAAMQSLPASLQAGKITLEELDNAVRPILEAKIRMRLFEQPFVDESKAAAVLDDPAHIQAARVAAERSAVLLRNQKDLLPLNVRDVKSIAVIGPLADSARDTLGPWVFLQNKPASVTVLAGLREKLGKAVRVDYAEGVRMPPRLYPSPISMMEPPVQRAPIDKAEEFRRAVDLARGADVSVLVLGEAQDMIGEIASRSSFDLPDGQQALLDAVVETGKPVVVLLMSARPLDLKNTKANAILDIWYPGSAGGNAAANLLFGDAIPGGKLPFTWVRNAAQSPMIYSHLTTHSAGGINKRYWNESNEPTYPFGFGLSYTSFKYSNLALDRPVIAPGESVNVTADITNTGARAGVEVAQLYVHQQTGTSARPVRELKGFQHLSLKPGETRHVSFTLAPRDLRYWTAASGSWVQDESVFDVWIGGSSMADLASHFEVKR